MKLNCILCAVAWVALGITAICEVWEPSPVSYGAVTLALALDLMISAFEK